MVCLECGKTLKSITWLHLKVCCGLTPTEYKEKHNIDYLMSDLCRTTAKNLDRDGVKNPFYGKKHTQEFKDKKREHSKQLWEDPEYRKRSTRKNCKGENNPFYGKKHSEEFLIRKRLMVSEQSKRQWKDPAYRELMLKAISQPRSEETKKEQSKRMIQIYKDRPHLREMKRLGMIRNWEEGYITGGLRYRGGNTSKPEQQLFEGIKKEFNIEKKAVRDRDGRWIFPDMISPRDMFIVEFYGDFWHANPNMYKQDRIMHHELTAQDIWNRDEKRINRLEDLGYQVWIVWESDFLENPDGIIKDITTFLNWESCSL